MLRYIGLLPGGGASMKHGTIVITSPLLNAPIVVPFDFPTFDYSVPGGSDQGSDPNDLGDSSAPDNTQGGGQKVDPNDLTKKDPLAGTKAETQDKTLEDQNFYDQLKGPAAPEPKAPKPQGPFSTTVEIVRTIVDVFTRMSGH